MWNMLNILSYNNDSTLMCCKQQTPKETDYDSEASSTSYTSDLLDQTNYILNNDPLLIDSEMDIDDYINHLRSFYNDFDSETEDIIWRRYCDLWVYEGYKEVPKTAYQLAQDIIDKAKSIARWDHAINALERDMCMDNRIDVSPTKNKME